jgi:hypothetical protein
MDTLLRGAEGSAATKHPGEAIAQVAQALDVARQVRDERNRLMRELTLIWSQSWYPRVPEAHGRKFLHDLDDVKDHPADRTVDLSYVIEREFLLPFGDWVEHVRAARNQYARENDSAQDKRVFDWTESR